MVTYSQLTNVLRKLNPQLAAANCILKAHITFSRHPVGSASGLSLQGALLELAYWYGKCFIYLLRINTTRLTLQVGRYNCALGKRTLHIPVSLRQSSPFGIGHSALEFLWPLWLPPALGQSSDATITPRTQETKGCNSGMHELCRLDDKGTTTVTSELGACFEIVIV